MNDKPIASLSFQALRAASRGLIFMSESDRPVKAIAWSSADVDEATTPLDAVAHAAGVEPEEIVVLSVEGFFAPLTTPQDWWGKEEKAIAAQFTALVAELSKLDKVATHRVGEGPDIDVYIIGHDPIGEGRFVGVKTHVTET